MNKQEEAISYLLDIAKSTESFALEHAPDVLQEIVLMGRVYSGIAVAISILTTYVAYKVFKKVTNSEYFESADENDWLILLTGMSIFGALLLSSFFGWNLKVWFAPKLYIIEYLAGLL